MVMSMDELASGAAMPEGMEDDSLRLRLLELAMENARNEAEGSDFWHRLLPHVSLAASFGIKDILFIDPSNAAPYVVPRDAYRLTISLSPGEIFDLSRHAASLLNLERLRTEEERIKTRQACSAASLRRRRRELGELFGALREECMMKRDLANFDSLRFQQGAVGYDVLVRSRLELLKARSALDRVRRMIGDSGGDLPEEGKP